MDIFVKNPEGKIITLNVESNEKIYNVLSKLEVKEGMFSGVVPTLIYGGEELGDWNTLAQYRITKGSTLDLVTRKFYKQEGNSPGFQRLLFAANNLLYGKRALLENQIEMESTLHLRGTIMNSEGPQSAPSEVRKRPTPQLAPVQTKKVRPATATQITTSKAAPSDGEATAALNDLMPEIQSRLPASVLADLEDVKRELATSRSKEKKLEAFISRLTQENKVFSARYESQIVALKAENKETKQQLTVARKEQEAIISGLTHKNEVFSAQCVVYESRIFALEAENKKTIEKLMVACNKEKVFSAQCASYESQVVALEAEHKKTKGELMVADKKYYSGARAAGYAEGLLEGKRKWLKSVEFLHHLTDAAMEYFNYGFDSCQKQAEQQGFVGQLNKDSALEDAPDVTGLPL